MTVAKLRGARDRKRRQAGWCEGNYPEAVRMAKRLYRNGHKRRSLRKIAAELAAAGHLTDAKYRGSKVARPFNQGTIKAR
jgi:hypothetical protein